MLTTITYNLTNVAIRKETLHGKNYIVAPMAMLTEGVHQGSNGPLLYKEAACKKAAVAWNMKPIVVYHPIINGQGVSACDPVILEKQQVGIVMQARWDGKLRAEAWIEEERAAAVDSRVLDALEANKKMEVSTGLSIDKVGGAGEWNGVPYDAEAVNHQPDHLALLPDKVGACSIADGAGLLQLNETAKAGGVDVTRLLAREMDTLRRLVGNAMSHTNIFSALNKALREQLGTDDVWIVDVYDDFCIYDYEKDQKLYRLNYISSGAGVELMGEPEEVIRVTEYRNAQGDFVGNSARNGSKKEDGMDKEKLVTNLITNAGTKWGESDRKALISMDEDTLTKMIPVENTDTEDDASKTVDKTDDKATVKTDDKPEEDKPVTMEQYVANAPPELRDILTNMVTHHNVAKNALIASIVANDKNRFSKEFLAGKGLQELEGIAALAKVTENMAPTTPAMFNNYAGASTLTGLPVANEGISEEPLVMPEM